MIKTCVIQPSLSLPQYSNSNLRRHPLRLTFFSRLADKDCQHDQNFAPHRSIVLHLQLIWTQEHGPKSPRQLSINTSKDADAVSSFCLQHRQCMLNPCAHFFFSDVRFSSYSRESVAFFKSPEIRRIFAKATHRSKP